MYPGLPLPRLYVMALDAAVARTGQALPAPTPIA